MGVGGLFPADLLCAWQAVSLLCLALSGILSEHTKCLDSYKLLSPEPPYPWATKLPRAFVPASENKYTTR